MSNLSRPFTAVAPPLDHRSRGSSPRWVSQSVRLTRPSSSLASCFPFSDCFWIVNTFFNFFPKPLSLWFHCEKKKKSFNFVAIDLMCRFRCSSSRWIQFKILLMDCIRRIWLCNSVSFYLMIFSLKKNCEFSEGKEGRCKGKGWAGRLGKSLGIRFVVW